MTVDQVGEEAQAVARLVPLADLQTVLEAAHQRLCKLSAPPEGGPGSDTGDGAGVRHACTRGGIGRGYMRSGTTNNMNRR